MNSSWKTYPIMLGIGLLALIPAADAWHMYRQNAVNVPFADHWCNAVPMVIKAADGDFRPVDLIAQHDAHRIGSANLTTYLFAVFGNWNLEAELIVNFAMLALILGGITIMLGTQIKSQTIALLLGVTLFSMLLFNARLRVMWLWPYTSPYLFSYLTLIINILILRFTRPNWISFVALLTITVAVTYSISSSFLLWGLIPLGMWIAGYRRWYFYAAWVLVGVLAFSWYFSNFSVGGDTTVFCETYTPILEGPLTEVDTLGEFLAYLRTTTIPIILFVIKSTAAPLYANYVTDIDRLLPTGMWLTTLFLFNLYYLVRHWWQEKNWIQVYSWGVLLFFALAGVLAIVLVRASGTPIDVFLFWSNYTFQPTFILIVGVAVAITTSVHTYQQANPHIARKLLLYANAVSLAFFALLYLNAREVAGNFQLVPHNMIPYIHPGPKDEYCLRNTFFAEEDPEEPCWRQFGWYGFVREDDYRYYVRRLAELRYAAFSEIAFELPESYEPADPVIVDFPLAAQQLRVINEQRDFIPEANIIRHIDPTEEPAVVRQGAVNIQTTNELPPLGNFWYFGEQELDTTYAYRWHHSLAFFDVEGREPYRVIPVFYGMPEPDEARPMIDYGEQFTMRNWSVMGSVDVNACESVTVASWWSPQQPIDQDYSMALILTNDTNTAVAQSDSRLGTELPTGRWRTDRTYWDSRTLTIPCDLDTGSYPLITTVYDYRDPDNALPTRYTDSGDPIGNWTYLTNINVTQP